MKKRMGRIEGREERKDCRKVMNEGWRKMRERKRNDGNKGGEEES